MLQSMQQRQLTLCLCLLGCLLLPITALAHGDVHEQIAALTKQIAREPQNAQLYLKRGELHSLHQDYGAALADFDRAARLDQNLAAVDLARGLLLLEAGRPAEATPVLNRFLLKQPMHIAALTARARALARLGRGGAAARDFTQAIAQSTSPAPELFLERAQALLAGEPHQLTEALQGLDEGIAQLGPLVTLQLLAIEIEIKREAYAAALQRVDQLAAKASRKETWLARRGAILELLQQPAEAAAAYQAALAAIDTLPARHRNAGSVTELEAQLRAQLKRLQSAGSLR